MVQTHSFDGPVLGVAFDHNAVGALIVAAETPGQHGADATATAVYRTTADTPRVHLGVTSRAVEHLAGNATFAVAHTGSSVRLIDIADSADATAAAAGTAMRKFAVALQGATITAMAVHPLDVVFAVGDSTGRIRLFYPLDADNAVQTMHWHAGPVRSLAFSPDGAYLLSGGGEAVLVQWQIASRQKSFLPRMGGEVSGITVDSAATQIAVVVASPANSVKVVRSLDSSLVSRLDGLRVAPQSKTLLGWPRSHDAYAVVDTGNGFLQLWDWRRGVGVSEVFCPPCSSHAVSVMKHVLTLKLAFSGTLFRTTG